MTGLTPYQTDSDSGGFVKSGIVTLGSSTRSRYTRSRRCELKTQESGSGRACSTPHSWSSADISFAALAKRAGVSPSYFTRVVRLSYLAPDITQAILDGRQPRDLTTDKLLAHSRLPLAWHEQRTALGFA